MQASINERYLNAKKQYEMRFRSVAEQNAQLRVQLLQNAMRNSFR
jgi:hypothetical protein